MPDKPEEEEIRVHPLDEIPTIDLPGYDEEKVIKFCEEEKRRIDAARLPWMERKLTFLHQWDDFITYEHDVILKNHKYIHVPITFEKIQTWHSRMFKSIFAMDPVFHMEALNKVTKDQVEATKLLLQWYLRDEINHKEGLKPVFDELLWDLGTDGWGCLVKRWEVDKRVVRDLQRIDPDALGQEMREAASEVGEIKKRGRPKKRLNEWEEIRKIVTIFDGVLLETVPQEAMYFPEHIPTSGDLNHPQLVMVEMFKDEQKIKNAMEIGYYDKSAGKDVLEKGKGFSDAAKMALMEEKKRLSGFQRQPSDHQEDFPLYVAFLRQDFDQDNIPEEYVLTISFKARRILRISPLDRICRDHSRPIYKFDLIKRPRSSQSRGWVETLYSLNEEIDEFHNLRRASGFIANVPWGFYRAGSGLEKEPIEVAPGKFYPVDDPQADVRPMQFPNVTGWAMSEEELAMGYADRLTSMPSYLQGSVSGPVGPLRSNSGLSRLLQESQAPLDVYLERFRTPFNRLMRGILSDLQTRLPETVSIRVLGDKGNMLYAPDGKVMFMDLTKDQYAGDYKFTLAASDAQYNQEAEKQNALQRTQMLINPFAIQTGVVSPENIFNIYKNLLLKHGEVDIGAYITEPHLIPKPVNLFHEYNAIIAGRVPMILMNDDHDSKIEGLMALANTPEYAEGKEHGTISPLADMIMAQVIQTHQAYSQILKQIQAAPNTSGMEISPTVGARSVGMGPGQVNNPNPEMAAPASEGPREGA